MDFDSAQPIYRQIIDEFKKKMIRGELSAGDRIPSQREYAEYARINPNTVQRAYREMEALKMVETLRGQGTYVSISPEDLEQMREEMARSSIDNFLGDMRALGYDGEEIMKMLRERQFEPKEDKDR
ncbi:GntR family transcriptional regulator [Syntrophomonas palmitatica]|uniref:GntR family transcriptional regulator n=1 Tax=Syntrophomonas palmitatica TaxID=402877 RepID=UPI0006CF3DD4|nr:GntR family transcriptional regulator [Syntrophomonas palmitatica]